jgi:hypothetical protein
MSPRIESLGYGFEGRRSVSSHLLLEITLRVERDSIPEMDGRFRIMPNSKNKLVTWISVRFSDIRRSDETSETFQGARFLFVLFCLLTVEELRQTIPVEDIIINCQRVTAIQALACSWFVTCPRLGRPIHRPPGPLFLYNRWVAS